MGPSPTVGLEELDEQLRSLDIDDIDIDESSISGPQIDDYKRVVEKNWDEVDFDEAIVSQTIELEEPPEGVISGVSVQRGLTPGNKISYAAGTLNVLVQSLLSDEKSRFVTTVIVTSVIIPMIVNDPDVSTYQDILTRVYWGLLTLAIVLGAGDE